MTKFRIILEKLLFEGEIIPKSENRTENILRIVWSSLHLANSDVIRSTNCFDMSIMQADYSQLELHIAAFLRLERTGTGQLSLTRGLLFGQG